MSWHDWIDHGIESQFNPRVAVGNAADSWLDGWAQESLRRKEELGGVFDIAYGTHELMQFDYASGDIALPVIINIHGGFWRALDKSAMMHHMAGLTGSGFGVVNVNYPLCPEVTLSEIIACLNDGIGAIVAHVDAQTQLQRFILMGHSAGAHLAMHLSHNPALRGRLAGVVALSGIYETSVVCKLSVNADVRLSAEEACRWDCVKQMPALGLSYYICADGSEPSGWID